MSKAGDDLLYKSLEELEEIAKSYKTTVASTYTETTLPEYDISEVSVDEFNNIIEFISNAIIKDSSKYELSENEDSTFFADTLRKYFEFGMTNDDILNLRNFVISFNENVSTYLYSNVYNYIYGFKAEADISPNSFFRRLVDSIKSRILAMAKVYDRTLTATNYEYDPTISTLYTYSGTTLISTKIIPTTAQSSPSNGNQYFSNMYLYTYNETSWDTGVLFVERAAITGDAWAGYADDNFDTTTTTAENFFNVHIQRGKSIETLVLLTLISYLNDDDELGLITVSSSDSSIISSSDGVSRDPLKLLVLEDFFKDYASRLKTDKDQIFTGESVAKVKESSNFFETNRLTGAYTQRTLHSLNINDLFLIPLYTSDVTGTVTGTTFNSGGDDPVVKYITFGFDSSVETFSFADIIFNQYKMLYSFLINIGYADEKNKTLEGSYFRNISGTHTLITSIYNDLQKEGELFYTKDYIHDNAYITTLETEKRRATVLEVSAAQNGQQLTFIDAKGLTITSDLAFFDEAFNPILDDKEQNLIGRNSGEGNDIFKLTYTVLYKEINKSYRRDILSDIQEYIFARLLKIYGKYSIFEANKYEISYNSVIDTLYRNYIEDTNILLLDISLDRYKYFFSNAYISRLSEESDIIGYYVADTGSEDIIGNYGIEDYEKYEIANFLDIYKETRDYYYRVLLNKSFILEEDYKLYEKLFITFFAIDRFLTSKINNLKDFDYYNDQDIENFLESYGLGVLNGFEFFVDQKNYKLNILRNFNELVRRKGSKDVITSLINVFDLGDRSIEIKKFLLVNESGFRNNGDFLKVSTFSINSEAFTFKLIDGGVDIPYILDATVNTTNTGYYDFGMYYSPDDVNIFIYSFDADIVTLRRYDIVLDSTAIELKNTLQTILGDKLGFTVRENSTVYLDYDTYNSTIALDLGIDGTTLFQTLTDAQRLDGVLGYGQYVADGGKTLTVSVFPDIAYVDQGLSFIEVPYESTNASKEIYNALPTKVAYSAFIADDIYWTEENVPEQLLLDTGIDVTETKYLSLIMNENVYKKFIMTRYMLSAVEYMWEELVNINYPTSVDSIIDNVKIDSGESVIGEVSIRSYFEAIKIVFKSLILMYEKEIGFAPTAEKDTPKYFGINRDTIWANVLDEVKEITTSTTDQMTEFTKKNRQIDTDVTSIDSFNLYKVGTEYENYMTGVAENDLINYEYLVKTSELTDVAKKLKNVVFATYRTAEKENEIQQNSGEYIANIFDNLNYIRINDDSDSTKNGTDKWMFFLSKYLESELSTKFEQTIDRTIIPTEFYYKVLEGLIELPMDYFEGILTPYYKTDINNNKAFVDMVENLFEEVYLTTIDPLNVDKYATVSDLPADLADSELIVEALGYILTPETIPGTGEAELTALTNETAEFLGNLIEGIQTIFASEPYMQFSFSLKDDEASTLNFIKTAVEIFLSYTTELYSTSYKRIYNTSKESLPISERIEHTLTSIKGDYAFYDEKLIIEKEE